MKDAIKEVFHPLVHPPRRIYWRSDGIQGYLIVGGILYDESGCECGHTGQRQACTFTMHDIGIPTAIKRLEAHERQHGV